jgi:hypothetical protein
MTGTSPIITIVALAMISHCCYALVANESADTNDIALDPGNTVTLSDATAAYFESTNALAIPNATLGRELFLKVIGPSAKETLRSIAKRKGIEPRFVRVRHLFEILDLRDVAAICKSHPENQLFRAITTSDMQIQNNVLLSTIIDECSQLGRAQATELNYNPIEFEIKWATECEDYCIEYNDRTFDQVMQASDSAVIQNQISENTQHTKDLNDKQDRIVALQKTLKQTQDELAKATAEQHKTSEENAQARHEDMKSSQKETQHVLDRLQNLGHDVAEFLESVKVTGSVFVYGILSVTGIISYFLAEWFLRKFIVDSWLGSIILFFCRPLWGCVQPRLILCWKQCIDKCTKAKQQGRSSTIVQSNDFETSDYTQETKEELEKCQQAAKQIIEEKLKQLQAKKKCLTG